MSVLATPGVVQSKRPQKGAVTLLFPIQFKLQRSCCVSHSGHAHHPILVFSSHTKHPKQGEGWPSLHQEVQSHPGVLGWTCVPRPIPATERLRRKEEQAQALESGAPGPSSSARTGASMELCTAWVSSSEMGLRKPTLHGDGVSA